jgi:hypothetical protein
MTDYNQSMDNSNGEEYKEEGEREQDEEEGNGGKSNGHAGALLVFSPIPKSNNRNRLSRIERPEPFDVLCGRGKPIQKHPGNIIIHRIVDEQCERYHTAPRQRKRGIADEIVQAIKKSKRLEQQLPGRFIRRERDDRGAYWKEISDDAARDKVSHCFRARRRLVMLNKKKTSTSPPLGSPPLSGRRAVAVASAPSNVDATVFDRSFAVMNDMGPSPYYSYHHQPQAASYQLHETLGEGYHQQPPVQMLGYYYASYDGAPLLGGGGPPAHWATIRDPNPTRNPQQEGQQGDGQQRTDSQDQQETQKSAEETTIHFYQSPSSQGSGRENDSKAN